MFWSIWLSNSQFTPCYVREVQLNIFSAHSFFKIAPKQKQNEINSESWKTWIFCLIVLKVSESPIMWIMVPNWRGQIGLSLVNSLCCFSRSKVTLIHTYNTYCLHNHDEIEYMIWCQACMMCIFCRSIYFIGWKVCKILPKENFIE